MRQKAMRDRESKNGFKSCKNPNRGSKSVRSPKKSAALVENVKLVPYSETSSEEDYNKDCEPIKCVTSKQLTEDPKDDFCDPKIDPYDLKIGCYGPKDKPKIEHEV